MVNVFFCVHYCMHEILTYSELSCKVCIIPALFHVLKGLDREMNILKVLLVIICTFCICAAGFLQLFDSLFLKKVLACSFENTF
jgi:hypothetical protein